MANWSPLLLTVTERRCGSCRVTKSLDQFYMKKRAAKYPGRLSSVTPRCKACMKEERSKVDYRAIGLMRDYGMTLDDWTAMFTAQGGRCAICSRHQVEVSKRLQVDHCHATGEVRGLLCSDCNMGLGLFRDNLETFAKVITYLQRVAGGNAEGRVPGRIVRTHHEKAG